MDDIISQGEDRGPGRSRRQRRLVLAVAVVLVASVVIVEHLPHGRPARAHQPVASTPLDPFSQDGSGPANSAVPDGIAGAAVRFAGSIRLPRTGVRPSWFWPATGRTELIGGLPADASGYAFARLNGGWAVEPDPGAQPGCGGCAGYPVPVYYLAANARSVTMAGIANQVAPAVTAGALWLTNFPPDAGLGTAAGTAREVTGTGRAIAPAVRLPVGYGIVQATSAGLLLTPLVATSGTVKDLLWSPAGPRRVFTDVIAATANAVAWVPTCVATCLVHVLSLATNQQILVSPPVDNSVVSALFSPDGRFLALGVSYGFGAESGDLTMRLEVAGVRSGFVEEVPQTWVSSDALVGFGWPDGDDLIAELSFTTKVQVVSWNPGAPRLAVVAVRTRQNPTSLIFG
jgi:hypothetical protein